MRSFDSHSQRLPLNSKGNVAETIRHAATCARDSISASVNVPALSIVIPTRNRARAVHRAINSVLASDRSNIELIVVDDGSTDETPSLLTEITDPRLTWQRIESDGNANRARNVGARVSRSALITFLDSDDAFEPSRIERLISFYAVHSYVDCLVDGYIEVNATRVSVHRQPSATPPSPEVRRLLLMHCLPLTNSALSIRRSAFEAVGGYDEAMSRHQDRELLLRLVLNHTIRLGQETDVIKYREATSLSHNLDGYVAGLNGLAARRAEYREAEYADIFRYLAVRGILKALAQGRPITAMREIRLLTGAQNLPQGFFRSLVRYRAGRRQRMQAVKRAYGANEIE
jgi:glycosyltransferase involved in cell wall biosynthesis